MGSPAPRTARSELNTESRPKGRADRREGSARPDTRYRGLPGPAIVRGPSTSPPVSRRAHVRRRLLPLPHAPRGAHRLRLRGRSLGGRRGRRHGAPPDGQPRPGDAPGALAGRRAAGLHGTGRGSRRGLLDGRRGGGGHPADLPRRRAASCAAGRRTARASCAARTRDSPSPRNRGCARSTRPARARRPRPWTPVRPSASPTALGAAGSSGGTRPTWRVGSAIAAG